MGQMILNAFKPCKSVGPRIFPTLLQALTKTLKTCVALYKRRMSYFKDFRSISLSSFMLKMLEKLVDVYVRDVILVRHPLQSVRISNELSTDTALYSAVSVIDGQLEGGYVVGIFLNTEGVFNNTSHEVVCRETAQRDISEKLVEWIRCWSGCFTGNSESQDRSDGESVENWARGLHS